MATSDNKTYLDQGKMDDLLDETLTMNNFIKVNEAGVQITDNQGDPIADWDGFKESVEQAILSLSTVKANGNRPEAGTFASLLVTVCPNGFPFTIGSWAIPEEEPVYTRLLGKVKRYANTGTTGKVQQALDNLPGGKVLMRGDIHTKSGPTPGCWLSVSDDPSGDIATTLSEDLEKWAESFPAARINLVTRRRRALAPTALLALDTYEAKVMAEIQATRLLVKAAIPQTTPKNGNGSSAPVPEAEDEEAPVAAG